MELCSLTPVFAGRVDACAANGTRLDGNGAMDVFAHGIATAAAVVTTRRSSRHWIRLGWAVFFGVFPDLVAFTIPACLRIWWWVTGASPTLLPTANGPHFEWVWELYNGTHSVLVLGAFFGVAWFVMRRPIVSTLGWLFHILLDTFTHRGMFAIQFLWPVSSVRLDGIPWETGWSLAVTYGVLVTVSLLLWRRRAWRASEQGDEADER